jgi:muramidase (phage lysozyme)
VTANPNREAFFAMVAWSEGTSRSPVTQCKGYDVIVTGSDGAPEAFTDFSAHPFAAGRAPKVINSRGLASTASGRYQILLRFWLYYAKLLGLPDFSPQSQDRYVIQQLEEHHALALVDAGHFDEAIDAVSGLWASLPGKQYIGQAQHELASLRSIYQAAGGIYVA